jgi:hypothetical protein
MLEDIVEALPLDWFYGDLVESVFGGFFVH